MKEECPELKALRQQANIAHEINLENRPGIPQYQTKHYAMNITSSTSSRLGQGSHIIVDSGATQHMITDYHKDTYLTNPRPTIRPAQIEVANGEVLQSNCQGQLQIASNSIEMKSNSKYPYNTLGLKNVLHVPKLKHSLLSVRQLDEDGY